MFRLEVDIIRSAVIEYKKNISKILKAQFFLTLLLLLYLPIFIVYSALPTILDDNLIISILYFLITVGTIVFFSYILTFILVFYRNPSKGILGAIKETEKYYKKIFLFLSFLFVILFLPSLHLYKKILDEVRGVSEYNLKNVEFFTRYSFISTIFSLVFAYIPADLIENRKIGFKSMIKSLMEFSPYAIIFYLIMLCILLKSQTAFFLFVFFFSPILNLLYWKIYSRENFKRK